MFVEERRASHDILERTSGAKFWDTDYSIKKWILVRYEIKSGSETEPLGGEVWLFTVDLHFKSMDGGTIKYERVYKLWRKAQDRQKWDIFNS
jgi:hypothetical protein